jgi:hypothetical protein
MNKQDWLKEAVTYIDSLNSKEFENFLMSCVPSYNVKIYYSDIKIGKNIVFSKAANMDIFYTDSISLAA